MVGGITRAAGRAGYVNDHRWQDRVRVHPASPGPSIVVVPDQAAVRPRPACVRDGRAEASFQPSAATPATAVADLTKAVRWGGGRWVQAGSQDQDTLDLVQADLVTATIIKLGRAGRGVVGDHRRFFKRAAVSQIGRNAGGPEGVIAAGHMPRGASWPCMLTSPS